MEDQVTNNNLNEVQNADQIQNVRIGLITLAEKGEIKYSVDYIKKARYSALEKIKGDYERKQLEETNWKRPIRNPDGKTVGAYGSDRHDRRCEKHGGRTRT